MSVALIVTALAVYVPMSLVFVLCGKDMDAPSERKDDVEDAVDLA